jgi:hypothetical protein
MLSTSRAIIPPYVIRLSANEKAAAHREEQGLEPPWNKGLNRHGDGTQNYVLRQNCYHRAVPLFESG